VARKVICVLCPRGCTILSAIGSNGQAAVLEVLSGEPCPRGIEYAKEEMITPMRTVTTTMEIIGGAVPLVSVRTTGSVPLEKTRAVVHAVSLRSAAAPVKCGQVLISDVLGLGVDIIATRTVE